MKKVGGVVVKVAMATAAMAAAGCAAEPSTTETQAADTVSLGEPMYARISATTNPNQPQAVDRFRIQSVLTWWGSFDYAGQPYPYTMVGTGPTVGGTNVIPTTITPARMTFANGLTLDGSSNVAPTVASPVFQDAPYSVGTTQFGDAVQRATFWGQTNPNYHVRLGAPVVRPTWDVTVPAQFGFAFQTPVGPVGLVDIDWFYSQVRTQLAPTWTIESFPIVLSNNVFLYIGVPQNCCVLGFHDAFVTGFNKVLNKVKAQTWTWASYSSQGLFRAPGIADVHALSHEVSEWMNDPFGINIVPPWQGNDAYGCSPLLETGDPIVGSAFPVTLGGTTYHPQNEVMLPWFARESPSSAYQGAYTYPDTTVLTTLPHDCN